MQSQNSRHSEHQKRFEKLSQIDQKGSAVMADSRCCQYGYLRMVAVVVLLDQKEELEQKTFAAEPRMVGAARADQKYRSSMRVCQTLMTAVPRPMAARRLMAARMLRLAVDWKWCLTGRAVQKESSTAFQMA